MLRPVIHDEPQSVTVKFATAVAAADRVTESTDVFRRDKTSESLPDVLAGSGVYTRSRDVVNLKYGTWVTKFTPRNGENIVVVQFTESAWSDLKKACAFKDDDAVNCPFVKRLAEACSAAGVDVAGNGTNDSNEWIILKHAFGKFDRTKSENNATE